MRSDRDSLSSTLPVVKEIGAHFSRSLNNLVLKRQKSASSFHHTGETRDGFFPPVLRWKKEKKKKKKTFPGGKKARF